MKSPKECQNLQEIRTEIDQLDRDIINLLGQRFEYVKVASKFKTNEISVKAPERLQAMLTQRRIWAESAGLNPDVIEEMYQNLVNYFINEELQSLQNNR
ncbi:Chorismate mutase, type II [Stanieria cyanosphaera PCC 7437]|uniref:Chorismate mutase, type II n=1 Tax=Stanieria cyanosphaera (strain ATCC 29371 / PCC 7437) TaxID=111780 RepID=K9XY48_STAC7|nr:isochorismate lyase [Stanieria cyanosphaera]AFZ37530.1 Chorismate mutase, type II [Stanieria cyanosphaera PCC 7437]